MRISWLSAEELAAARRGLTANGRTWNDHFHPEFVTPAEPDGIHLVDWRGITEHVASAERVSEVVRKHGLEDARAQFASSRSAIEVATLAAAAHACDSLTLDQVLIVLRCPIDVYVFYATFLELMIGFRRDDAAAAVKTYEELVAAYTAAVAHVANGAVRSAAMRDGLADFYVSVGRIESAEHLFEQRHAEDLGDVAVALTAARAFLTAGHVRNASRWLGAAESRARALGRLDLAAKLRAKQDALDARLKPH